MEDNQIISPVSKQIGFPSPGRLFAYFLISLLLSASTSSTSASSVRHPSSQLIGLLILASIVYVAVKLVSLIGERHKDRQIFIRGKVPTLESENLLSGSLFSVVRLGNNLEIINEHHARCGKTFGMFFGPDPWVFTTDLELIYRLFVSEGNKYVDITQYRLPYLSEMSNSLAQVRGDDWRRARRILDPSFTAHQMKSDNVYRDIQASCSRLMDCIEAHPIDSHGVRTIDIQYGTQKFTAEVILRVAYGQENIIDMRPGAQDELIEAVREAAKVFLGPVVCASIIFGGKVQYLFGKLAKLSAIGKYFRHIHSLLDDSLKSRLRGQTKTKGSSERRMIDSIIECMKSGQMDEQTLRANLFFVFVAGFDTTANTLTCLFWLLAKNQSIQDELRNSIASEGEKSHYLDWCIKETLRLYPAVPTAIGRVLTDDISFGDRKFFKGTTINASIFSIHRSREYWGPDVLDFKPERFDEQRNGQLHPAQYMPFALGPRTCIGQHLAMSEMRALASRILLKYKLDMCETTPADLTYTSTNLIHLIIDGPVDVKLTEISSI